MFSRQPLNEHAQALIEAVQSVGQGDWASPDAIARALGRDQLKDIDVDLLRLLTVQGVLYARKREGEGEHEFDYRIASVN